MGGKFVRSVARGVALCVTLAALGAGAAQAQPARSVGELVSALPNAYVQVQRENAVLPAAIGMRLYARDKVTVQNESQATIRLMQTFTIQIGAHQTFTVPERPNREVIDLSIRQMMEDLQRLRPRLHEQPPEQTLSAFEAPRSALYSDALTAQLVSTERCNPQHSSCPDPALAETQTATDVGASQDVRDRMLQLLGAPAIDPSSPVYYFTQQNQLDAFATFGDLGSMLVIDAEGEGADQHVSVRTPQQVEALYASPLSFWAKSGGETLYLRVLDAESIVRVQRISPAALPAPPWGRRPVQGADPAQDLAYGYWLMTGAPAGWAAEGRAWLKRVSADARLPEPTRASVRDTLADLDRPDPLMERMQRELELMNASIRSHLATTAATPAAPAASASSSAPPPAPQH
ncbi:MAG TPA: hypothetical protein VG943_12655 [Caulobacterales bacterium]|nr:hypothetical protein [Caulobacterales bacterium]